MAAIKNDKSANNTVGVGTLKWMAPEQFEPGYTHKVDVYAFGVILNEMCTGEIPFNNLEQSMIYPKIKNGERPTLATNRHPGLIQLIRLCWDQNPAIRPNFLDILNSLFRIQQELISKPKHVMISYQWDCQLLAKQLYYFLSERNIPVWMDIYGGITGANDINHSISQGIERAYVICPLFNQKFQNSDNCRRELTFAKEKGVTILPLKIESGPWKASDWLGVLLAGTVYIDFSDPTKLNEKLGLLYTELDNIRTKLLIK